MKKIKLKSIIAMLLVALISSGITVAAVKLYAKDIGFTSNDKEWQVNNVEDAMNDLYVLGKNSVNNVFTKMFPDFYTYTSHESSQTKNPPSITVNDSGFSMFIRWGMTTQVLQGNTFNIDFTNINKVHITYNVILQSYASSSLSIIDSSGSIVKTLGLTSSTETTATIDVSDVTGMGKFQIVQKVNCDSGSGYSATTNIYNIVYE